MEDSQEFKRAKKLVIKHYWHESTRRWKLLLGSLLAPAIGSILISYIPPLLITKSVEQYQRDSSSDFQAYVPYLAIFAGSWLLGELLWRLGIILATINDTHIAETLNMKGLSQLLERDLDFFHNNFAGSLTKRTLAYASRYIDISDTLLFTVSPYVLPMLFASVVLCFYSPLLAICLLGWLLLTFIILMPRIRHRQKLVNLREAAHTVVSGHVADVYGNIDAVRAHAHEKAELVRHRRFVRDLVQKTRASWDYHTYHIDFLISPLYVATNASGLALGIYLMQNGTISATALIVVFTYFASVTRFMWEFNGIYRRLETAISDAAQYTELLLTEPTILDDSSPRKLRDPKGAISFEDVHFAYEKNSNSLFANFSFDIKAGEKVGLVGRSGGGKSSITKLLLRLVDIDDGSIRIDGLDIRSLTQQDLRNLIAYVPQDPVMFHRSLHENIAYGKQDATREEVIAAAKKAHAHEFIESLPKGYETLVGERGIKLSGGQRQRVAIARAILKNSPILLLDEATSALDSESELLIQDALQELMKAKTTIVIAHRLSTIQNMDRIIVLDKGEILEHGPHDKLIKSNGVYAELWKHQSGGFIED